MEALSLPHRRVSLGLEPRPEPETPWPNSTHLVWQ